MKKVTVISILCFCLISMQYSFGQNEYKNYDLSKYITPDIVRNSLDISLNSKGNFYKEKSEQNQYAINGDLDATFYRTKNTRAFYGYQTASVGFGGAVDKENASNRKNKNHSLKLLYINQSRFYLKDKLFFETGGSVNFNHSKEKYHGETSITKYKNHSISMSVPLRVGKGRIEDVTEARQAIYILENLSKNGVLKRTLSDEEIYLLSQVMSKVKNKRFLDSRTHLMEEIATVDSFFVENNLLETSGAAYFTTLYDYWMYGDRFERKSGTVISFGITPGFDYSNYDRTITGTYIDGYEDKTKSPSIKADISLNYEKPINLYWQNSANVSVNGSLKRSKIDGNHSNDYNYTDKYKNAVLEGNYSWGYYPTSRTNLNMGIREYFTISKADLENRIYDSQKRWETYTSLYLSAYYYISPQIRLSAEGGLTFEHNDYKNEYSDHTEKNDYSRWSGNFELKLIYSLF